MASRYGPKKICARNALFLLLAGCVSTRSRRLITYHRCAWAHGSGSPQEDVLLRWNRMLWIKRCSCHFFWFIVSCNALSSLFKLGCRLSFANQPAASRTFKWSEIISVDLRSLSHSFNTCASRESHHNGYGGHDAGAAASSCCSCGCCDEGEQHRDFHTPCDSSSLCRLANMVKGTHGRIQEVPAR